MTNHDSVEELRRLLEVRVQEWRLREGHSQSRPNPVVAITREPGCGGESIAERLSVDLGLLLYNWELVEQIAKDTHVSTRLVSTLDEHTHSELEEWVAEFTGNCNLSSKAYIESLKRVLFAIAAHGNAVIVGRGSNFFLPTEKRIGVCLVAPLELKISNTMKELGLSEKSAREHISKVEEEQRRLVKEYFQADIRDSTCYHLVVNTALVKPETIVHLVKAVIMAQA